MIAVVGTLFCNGNMDLGKSFSGHSNNAIHQTTQAFICIFKSKLLSKNGLWKVGIV